MGIQCFETPLSYACSGKTLVMNNGPDLILVRIQGLNIQVGSVFAEYYFDD